MHSLLLPSRILPSLESPDADPRISAMFLYFDQISFLTVTPLTLPDALSPERVALILPHLSEDDLENFHIFSDRNLDPKERIAIAAIRYARSYQQFWQCYQPLADAGVIQFDTLAGMALGVGGEDLRSTPLESVNVGLLRLWHLTTILERDGFLQDENDLRLVGELFFETASTDDYGLSTLMFSNALEYHFPEDEQLRDIRVLAARLQMLELIAAAIAASTDSYITLDASYPAAVSVFAKRLGEMSRLGQPSAAAMRATEVMNHVLASFPAIRVRSAMALLELRHKLTAELDELREKVNDIVADLGAKADDQDAIASEVDRRLKRPVRDLTRRLLHPSRDIARTLFSNQSLLTATVTLTAAFPVVPPLSSAALSIAIPLLAASLQALLDRKRQIEQSGVAFIMRATSTAL